LTHVATPPFTHDVWAAVHVSVHVDEHAAVGELPAQLIGGVQAEVVSTFMQEAPEAVPQVATVWPS
jgi:hypothetical protein